MNEAVHAGPLEVPHPNAMHVEAADDRELGMGRIGDGTQPAWQRDVVSVSARVRAIVATLRPIVVHVLTFWDHAVRAVRIGAARLEVDPSGSYRLVR